MRSDYERISSQDIEEKLERAVSLLVGLYTERTHFILELLQNAEDAKANHVRFDLQDDRLEVWHNGRLFNEKDVRGVCGVGEGTKRDDLTQIGKFGIGFKSVYSFTARPEIHCGEEHFAIDKYIHPVAVTPVDVPSPWTTLFILPFDRTDITAEVACGEIAQGLANLQSRTMLFLRHIGKVEWSVLGGPDGCYVRHEVKQRPGRRVSIVGATVNSQYDEAWLLFEAPVLTKQSNEPLRVEAAFRIVEDTQSGRSQIMPVADATLSVFFPTDRRTSLGFLIQGPYRTTPARDNVPKENQENQELLAATAALVASTLSQLRDLGLLTVGAIRTLPLREVDFQPGSMFRPIFDAVASVMRAESLIPTDCAGFVTTAQARISTNEIRELFPSDTLMAFVGEDERLEWVTSEITANREPDLYKYFREILKIEEFTAEGVIRGLTTQFLERMSDDWLMRFYEFLRIRDAVWRKPRWKGETPGPARSAPIIRLEDGTHVVPFREDGSSVAYLSAPLTGDDIRLVRKAIVANEPSRLFLERLGFANFGLFDMLQTRFLAKYRVPAPLVPLADNIGDMQFFAQALKQSKGDERQKLLNEIQGTPVVRAINAATHAAKYVTPGEAYFRSELLSLYFSGYGGAWFVSDEYPEDLRQLFVDFGVSPTVRLQSPERRRDYQGYVSLGAYKRGARGFDPDFDIAGIEHAVGRPTLERSRYVWNNIALPNADKVRGNIETSSRMDFAYHDSTPHYSKLGRALVNAAWLPFGGQFFKPSELSVDDLPEDFERDETLPRQLAMKVNEVAALAQKIGVDVEALTLAQQITDDSDLYAQVRQWIDAKVNRPTFPSRPTPNPQRRSEHVSRDAETAPPKTYEERQRIVRTSEPAQNPSTWLRELYTNTSGQMVCQICEEEMPFKKHDGQYYFEAVEAFNTFSKELHQLHLALCPVCAAKYKEFVKRDDEALRLLETALVAAEAPLVPLQLGDEEATLRFVESHFLDIRTFIRAQADD